MMENLKEIDLLLMAVPEDIHDNAWVQDAIKMLRRLNMRFEPQLPKLIAARFPGVCDFEIDHLAERVQPVEYEDCKGRMTTAKA